MYKKPILRHIDRPGHAHDLRALLGTAGRFRTEGDRHLLGSKFPTNCLSTTLIFTASMVTSNDTIHPCTGHEATRARGTSKFCLHANPV